MTDPLGLIGGAGNINCQPPLRAQDKPAPGAPSFKDALLKNLEQVNKLQQEATTAIEDLQTGKRDDLEGVLLATQKADLAFKTLLAVRNKVQAAYDEIKQIRV